MITEDLRYLFRADDWCRGILAKVVRRWDRMSDQARRSAVLSVMHQLDKRFEPGRVRIWRELNEAPEAPEEKKGSDS